MPLAGTVLGGPLPSQLATGLAVGFARAGLAVLCSSANLPENKPAKRGGILLRAQIKPAESRFLRVSLVSFFALGF